MILIWILDESLGKMSRKYYRTLKSVASLNKMNMHRPFYLFILKNWLFTTEGQLNSFYQLFSAESVEIQGQSSI